MMGVRLTPTWLFLQQGAFRILHHSSHRLMILICRYTNLRESIRKVCGDEITEQLKELAGLDEEYEMNSIYRDCGVENLWFVTGTNCSPCRSAVFHAVCFAGSFAVARHHSRHLALRASH